MPTAPTSTNKNMDERIQAIIREIAEKSAGGGYLYRGEPEYYTTISSSLYRAYNEPDFSPVTIEDIQQEMLEEAGRYTDETDEEAILTQLQHYGGATNLIDFTTDCLIALFFACDGGVDKDGRVILLREEETPYYHAAHPGAARAGAEKPVRATTQRSYRTGGGHRHRRTARPERDPTSIPAAAPRYIYRDRLQRPAWLYQVPEAS